MVFYFLSNSPSLATTVNRTDGSELKEKGEKALEVIYVVSSY